jgi:hypothetical protein
MKIIYSFCLAAFLWSNSFGQTEIRITTDSSLNEPVIAYYYVLNSIKVGLDTAYFDEDNLAIINIENQTGLKFIMIDYGKVGSGLFIESGKDVGINFKLKGNLHHYSHSLDI